tara:strand:+ start:5208 stop:5459 length:252 start_codon:yes stop_codon:yes gene_type:complete
MNKIIITIGLLSGLSCQQDGTKVELPEQAHWNHLVDNIADMREWMREDMKQGIIDSAYAEYYIEYLDEAEDLSIYLYNINTNE